LRAVALAKAEGKASLLWLTCRNENEGVATCQNKNGGKIGLGSTTTLNEAGLPAVASCEGWSFVPSLLERVWVRLKSTFFFYF